VATPHVAARLPLHFATGRATRLITVTAASTSSTEGSLQAWRKVDGEWGRVGGAAHAWLGSDGLSTHPSESRSATPIGSFTLTRAFGHDADPGTTLPYTRTTPGDWWISQPGSLYNTMQSCPSNCSFTRGSPNEHLYYETPYYNYALVIDYNTRNAPGGVRPGAGSAFFLHVTVGAPTQGCISIAQDRLVALLRWLTPEAHPRILIGTT
jgi:L,D-peptidoglycan transpeptidase YkuD (ErfK/YbiS/YcfS/YnhG family)